MKRLDPHEYLPDETFQWCQNQLAQLNLSSPPQARDFIPGKPRGGYGWEPQQEVVEGLAAGNEEI
jgi:hypothetical protein